MPVHHDASHAHHVPAVSVTGSARRPINPLSTRTTGRRSQAAGEGRRGEWGTWLSGLYGDLVGADGAVWGL